MGLGVPERAHERTDIGVKTAIRALGRDLNPMSGVPGDFYTTHRERDLLELVRELLKVRRVLTKQPTITTHSHSHGKVCDVFALLASTHVTLLKAEVVKLELKPGDALILKLGDRATGWIPDATQELRTLWLVEQLLKELKLDVPVMVHHYGFDVEVVRPEMP